MEELSLEAFMVARRSIGAAIKRAVRWSPQGRLLFGPSIRSKHCLLLCGLGLFRQKSLVALRSTTNATTKGVVETLLDLISTPMNLRPNLTHAPPVIATTHERI